MLALITLGEGWHNNHHTYMSSANQGFFWWEFDVSYYALAALVLEWESPCDLRKLSDPQALEAKRIVSKRALKNAKASEPTRQAPDPHRLTVSPLLGVGGPGPSPPADRSTVIPS